MSKQLQYSVNRNSPISWDTKIYKFVYCKYKTPNINDIIGFQRVMIVMPYFN
jgi:hypothetical protein